MYPWSVFNIAKKLYFFSIPNHLYDSRIPIMFCLLEYTHFSYFYPNFNEIIILIINFFVFLVLSNP